jgi:hypothetical protein
MNMNFVSRILGVCALVSLSSFTHGAVPDAPANVMPAWIHATPANFARITWNAVAGAESYRVYRYNDLTMSWAEIASGVTNLLVLDVADSDGMSYHVTAVNGDGESAPSSQVTTTDSEYLGMFTHTPPDWWPYMVTPTSATIQWISSLVDGTDGMLELGLTPTNLTVVGFNENYAPGHSFNLTDLTPLTRYYYRFSGVGTNRAGVAVLQTFMTPDVNHPPVATDVTLGSIVDPWPVAVPLSATDPEGPWTTLEYYIVTPPTNGTLSSIYYYGYYDPRYVDYTPNPGARGADSFQYVVSDGELFSAPATVSIPSLWLNRTPQGVSFTTNILEDVPVEILLSASDEDNDPVTIEVGGCIHGTITGTPPNIIYTPAPEFSGTDMIFFNAVDGYAWGFGSGIVTIEVQAVNDPPAAMPQDLATDEDNALAVTLSGSDVDSGALTFVVGIGPSHGALSGTPPDLLYTPAANYSGADSFTFRANDGNADSG